jgi:DNA polymerase III epsilon subunit family exonuclease
MSRRLSDVEFVAFDLETTGLSPVACRIIEFGAVRFRFDGREIDCFEQLVDPCCPIPPEATRVNHITQAMVRGQPVVAAVLPRFVSFLGGPETILMAHNARFDLGFLAAALFTAQLELPAHAVLDTLALSRKCLRTLRSHRLENVAMRLGVATHEDHRALSDARLAMRIFRAMLACRPDVETIEKLFELAAPKAFDEGGHHGFPAPAQHEELQLAIRGQLTVVIHYSGAGGEAVRRVTPRAILQARGRRYLSAFCHRDHIEKTYRLDRILKFRLEP